MLQDEWMMMFSDTWCCSSIRNEILLPLLSTHVCQMAWSLPDEPQSSTPHQRLTSETTFALTSIWHAGTSQQLNSITLSSVHMNMIVRVRRSILNSARTNSKNSVPREASCESHLKPQLRHEDIRCVPCHVAVSMAFLWQTAKRTMIKSILSFSLHGWPS